MAEKPYVPKWLGGLIAFLNGLYLKHNLASEERECRIGTGIYMINFMSEILNRKLAEEASRFR